MSEDIPTEKEIKASAEVTPKDTPKKKKEITMSGKGDKPRPRSTSHHEFARKWDKAFGKKEILDETLGKEISEELDKEILDDVGKVLRESAELASESVIIPTASNIEEISKRIKKKNPCRDIDLTPHNSVEAEIAKIKDAE